MKGQESGSLAKLKFLPPSRWRDGGKVKTEAEEQRTWQFMKLVSIKLQWRHQMEKV